MIKPQFKISGVKMILAALILSIFFCLLAWANPFAPRIDGTVVGVADGDTLTVLDSSNKQHKIRLAEIDAPEKEQPFGQRSKQALSDLCYKKNAIVEVTDRDRYGREVGIVSCDGVEANLKQIETGLAWFYVQYGTREYYRKAEENARSSKVGLWGDNAPIPPWSWRRGSRSNSVEKSSSAKVVKKSNAGICHAPGTKYYGKTKNFTAFPTLDDCLTSGGRLPK